MLHEVKTMIRLYFSTYSINHNNNCLMALLVNHFCANKPKDINNQYKDKSRQTKYSQPHKIKAKFPWIKRRVSYTL